MVFNKFTNKVEYIDTGDMGRIGKDNRYVGTNVGLSQNLGTLSA